jgi:hypothetical protein
MADADVQTLLDILEIQRMKARYCEIVDRSVDDPSLVAGLTELFAEDITSDYGFGTVSGREAILRFAAESSASVDLFWHGVSSPQVVVDGDAARASWTVTARSRRKGEATVNTVFGRYVDTLVRTPAGWRFTAMNFEIQSPTEPWTPSGS